MKQIFLTLLLLFVIPIEIAAQGTSLQQATALSNGQTVSGDLSSDRQDDWYKIEIPEEGTLTLTTQSDVSLRLGTCYVYALNSDGGTYTRLSKDMDNYETDDAVSGTVTDLKAGTYYIQIHRYLGDGGYSARCDFSPCSKAADKESNDTREQAETLLENGKAAEARLGYNYNGDYDNDDWYKIEIPEEGTLTLTTQAEVSLRLGTCYVYALNSDGGTYTRLSKDMDNYDEDTAVSATVTDLKAGTYYIQIHRYLGVGGYLVKYDFTPCPMAADPEPNNTKEGAQLIQGGQTFQGRLGYHYNGDYDNDDFFYFDVAKDASAVVTLHSEKELRLGTCYVYALTEEGSTYTRASMDMDNYNNDTTLVMTAEGLAPGRYYLQIHRYLDVGGYSCSINVTQNPYSRSAINNTTWDKAVELADKQTISTTIGYQYTGNTNTEDWYDLGTIASGQCDITIAPDTTKTLSLSVCYIYELKGTDSDGKPQWTTMASQRLERSQGTISFQAEGGHYYVQVARYSGYGGYTITRGNPDAAVNSSANSNISISWEGRNTVRKGVPCEYKVTVRNNSTEASGPFFLVAAASDNVKMLEFRLPSNQGTITLPMSEVEAPNTSMFDESEGTAVFVVPGLDPLESYSFNIIAEGEGDIAYAPRMTRTFQMGKSRVVITGTTILVVGGLCALDCAVDIMKDKMTEAIVETGNTLWGLDPYEEQQYARCLGLTVDQLHENKPKQGVAAYTAKSVLKTACTKLIEAVPGGKVVTAVAGDLELLAGVATQLRRRLWYWIYKDLGYIKDDMQVADGKAGVNDVVGSWDPNEMVGPAGVGGENYIRETLTMNYTIMFENKKEAGDAAYRIRISDELDESVFDVNSVRFGNTSHDGPGYNWKMLRDGNHLSWDIEGIELPPNVNAPEGEGYVTFSVDLKPGLKDGTKLKNKATIIFDKNTPIETNEYVNTLDLSSPVTKMMQPTYSSANNTITVNYQSSDNGSGVAYYRVYASKDGEAYEYVGTSFDESYAYNIDSDGDYSFYVIAVDEVGNVEKSAPAAASISPSTGVRTLKVNADSQGRIYTLDGRMVHTTIDKLPRGIYIMGGKKLVVK